MARIADLELKAICEAEIQSATGWASGELAKERADAMDYYLGMPYGDEIADRSQTVTREVLEGVETAMPSLMRIFMEGNAVEFRPVGPNDKKAAEQETDVVRHVAWQQNEGFLNFYSAFKDGLLSKTGVLKVWWDDSPDEEREEYRGLNDMELAQLLNEQGVEREIIEYEGTDKGEHDITFTTRRSKGRVSIIACPPEEVGVNRDARSPNIQDCSWVHHRVRKTKAALIEEGYDRKVIEPLPADDDIETEEREARRHLEDEREYLSPEAHWSRHTVWVTECYVRLDRNDDGIAELLKVTLAAGGSDYSTGSVLLDVEEVDRIPFVSASPILLTHKYYGLSLADLIMPWQRIKSALLRGVLDNMYLANNQRTAVNEMVNLDDLLTSRPGGIVRTRGEAPPGQNVFPFPQQAVPTQIYDLFEYIDNEIKGSTGHSDTTAALDIGALSNLNTGVAAMAFDQARAKLELIARIYAECLMRPLSQAIHELLRKHQDEEMILELRGEFVSVKPSTWRTRTDMKVTIGTGEASRERRLMAIDDVMTKQGESLQMGLPLANIDTIHAALTDYTKLSGLDATRYWPNLDMVKQQMAQQQQQPKPDPQMLGMQLQAEGLRMNAEVQAQRNQVEMAKVQSTERIRIAELEQKEAERLTKARIEELKAELVAIKSNTDAAGKTQQAVATEQKTLIEAQIRGLELRMEEQREQGKRDMEQYSAELRSWTELERQRMQIMGAASEKADAGMSTMQSMVTELRAALLESRQQLEESKSRVESLQTALMAPRRRTITRDDDGQAIAIDDQPIIRDAAGNIVGLG